MKSSEEKLSKAFKNAVGEKEKPDITTELIKRLSDDCPELKHINPKKLEEGIEVEMEHFDSVNGDMEIIAKIVADHIKEFSGYYPALKNMERELE